MDITYDKAGSEALLNAKPSELIEIALTDLEETEKDPTYEVAMGWWHVPNKQDGICMVCFAGAVLAQRLKVPHDQEITVGNFPHPIQKRLLALDSVRAGAVRNFLHYCDIPYEQADEVVSSLYARNVDEVTTYEADSEEFKEDLRKIVAVIKEHNL